MNATQKILYQIAAQVDTLGLDADAIIAEARQQAIAEAIALLKELMTRQILDAVLRCLEEDDAPVAMSMNRCEEHSAATSLTPDDEDDSQRLRQEMEAIRAQIVENERRMREAPAPSESPEPEMATKPQTPVDSGTTDVAESVYYVYGLWARNGQEMGCELAPAGIDPRFPVYTLPGDRLEAIVSRVSGDEFNQDSLQAKLSDADWLATTLQAHQQVLEAALAHRTVLPMRFCTLYHSEDRVQQMANQYTDACLAALERLDDAKEWGIKAYCDYGLLGPQIEARNDRIADLRAEIKEKPAGAAYFAQKKLQEALAEEMERFRDRCAQQSHDRLTAIARERLLRAPQSRETTARDEEMILNGAYLVADADLDAFRDALEALGNEFADYGVAYELTGPWPAYSFVTIEGDQEHP